MDNSVSRFPNETLRRFMKQAIPDMKISDMAVKRMNDVLMDTLRSVSVESKKFANHSKRKTILEIDIIASTT
jgi:histone H3/H4